MHKKNKGIVKYEKNSFLFGKYIFIAYSFRSDDYL